MLGMILQKSTRTIREELRRGMVEHVLADIPFSRTEYNADHARIDAEGKMKYKGQAPRAGAKDIPSDLGTQMPSTINPHLI